MKCHIPHTPATPATIQDPACMYACTDTQFLGLGGQLDRLQPTLLCMYVCTYIRTYIHTSKQWEGPAGLMLSAGGSRCSWRVLNLPIPNLLSIQLLLVCSYASILCSSFDTQPHHMYHMYTSRYTPNHCQTKQMPVFITANCELMGCQSVGTR